MINYISEWWLKYIKTWNKTLLIKSDAKVYKLEQNVGWYKRGPFCKRNKTSKHWLCIQVCISKYFSSVKSTRLSFFTTVILKCSTGKTQLNLKSGIIQSIQYIDNESVPNARPIHQTIDYQRVASTEQVSKILPLLHPWCTHDAPMTKTPMCKTISCIHVYSFYFKWKEHKNDLLVLEVSRWKRRAYML